MVKNFIKEDNGLIPVRVEIWGPFIYVNLSGDAPPVKDYLGRTVTDLEAFPFDELVTVKEDKFEEALSVAKEQVENGATIIDINMDVQAT